MRLLKLVICRSLWMVCALLCCSKYAMGGTSSPQLRKGWPCPSQLDPDASTQWEQSVQLPPLFSLRVPALMRLSGDVPEPGTTNIGFPLFDAMFYALRKKNNKLRPPNRADDFKDTWRTPRFGRSDQMYAERGYSFVRLLPTACVTAGALTLSLTIGSQAKFHIAFKPARMGGLIGFRGRFE
jgi:hypothetical protein